MFCSTIREAPGAFVINLDRSPDRLAGICTLLIVAGMQMHRIAAIDGAVLTDAQRQRYDEPGALARMLHPLSPGEIACCLSHEAALAALVSSGAPHGLILEDDAEFATPLASSVQIVADAMNARFGERWSVVNLCRAPKQPRTRLAALDGTGLETTLFAAHHYPMGAVGLLWSRQGAIRYLEEALPIVAPFDVLVRDFCYRHDGGFAVDPPLVWFRAVASDIDGVCDRNGKWTETLDAGYFLRRQHRNIAERLDAVLRKFRFHWS